jgi:hypothetical protein
MTMTQAMARLEALLTPPGQTLLARLATENPTRENELQLATFLRRTFPADLVSAAFWQQELRLLARAKFSRAMDMYFTRPGFEQASSEEVARHRAGRYAQVRGQVADLCAGIGGDLIALAATGPVLAVDRDPVHLRMAGLNAAAYGVAGQITPLLADVRDIDLPAIGAVFIDPARRTGEERLLYGRSEPPLAWCFALADRIPAVGIKAAPGIPHDLIPPAWECEFVARDRDLKEAVLWSPALSTARRRATVLPGGDTLRPCPGEPARVLPPGRFLLDPNPAVTRAGLVEDLAREIGAWKIDDRIAFLAVDRPLRSPFARTLEVIESMPWHEKRINRRLQELDVGAVDIRRRGLAGEVNAIYRRLKLRGNQRVTLVMTRLLDKPWALICRDTDVG